MGVEYKKLALGQDFSVTEIVTVHYFEYPCDYRFDGESHDFWELLYVDKGEVMVGREQETTTLGRGQMIFHRPGEFHTVQCNGVHAPNLIVIAFDCRSPLMEAFNSLICTVGQQERVLLGTIIREAQKAFISPLDNPQLKELVRALKPPLGSEQLIKMALESLLIMLCRQREQGQGGEGPASVISRQGKEQLLREISLYLEANVTRQLTLEEICRENHIGKSYLQKLFKERTGGGAIEYFGRLKIATAQQMMRQGNHNFTEVSRQLGYSSLHYFSRHFKKVCGMTPSEYACSVKLLSHHPETSLFSQ